MSKSEIRCMITRMTASDNGLKLYAHTEVITSTSPLFDACDIAHERATKKNHNYRLSFYNATFGWWETIADFHPDGTATDILGVRKRWTGIRGAMWDKVENEN